MPVKFCVEEEEEKSVKNSNTTPDEFKPPVRVCTDKFHATMLKMIIDVSKDMNETQGVRQNASATTQVSR